MFIVTDTYQECRIFETEEELIEYLREPDEDFEIKHIFNGTPCREHYCKLAFEAWWDSWVKSQGAEANKATSRNAPRFLGELMGAIWLERKISDKCSESGK